jgi:hypothetical protein
MEYRIHSGEDIVYSLEYVVQILRILASRSAPLCAFVVKFFVPGCLSYTIEY